MNSKQRRKAYRAMPKAGAVVRWKSTVSGKTREGVMIGPSDLFVNDHPKAWRFELSKRPTLATHRVMVRMAGGSTCHILARQLIK